MSNISVTETKLWKSAFIGSPVDPLKDQRQRLQTALLAFRANVEPIVARISGVLPGLTVHDITHLDALWETAEILVGTAYPLNPLEAFVFGGAVLLHDSAMCWEAYQGGQEGVRATLEWKDAYAHERDQTPNNSEQELMQAADFSALRALHAHQAEKLPGLVWRHPDNGQELYLIEDTQLRLELGGLIGRIAASHHWNVDALSAGLGGQFNAPASFPSEWAIDPV